MIVVDTMRFDYSDMIDSLNWLKKIKLVSTSSWTFPSHVSLFTGLVPSDHGIFEKNAGKGINHYFNPWRFDSIQKYVRMEGYEIIWITANPYLTPTFGFDGFDEIYEIGETKKQHPKSVGDVAEIRYKLTPWFVEKGVTQSIEILKNKNFRGPVFLFLNLMEVHDPYVRNDPDYTPEKLLKLKIKCYDSSVCKRWLSGYKHSVNYLNKKLYTLMNILQRKLNNPIFVILGDHGQLLGEYDKLGHELWLYDEVIHTPLWTNVNIPSDVLSIIDVPRLIISELEGNEFLPQKVFFSETYGPASYPESERELAERYMQWRIAVEDRSGKIIYNVDEEKIEWSRGNTEYLVEKIMEYIKDPSSFSSPL